MTINYRYRNQRVTLKVQLHQVADTIAALRANPAICIVKVA